MYTDADDYYPRGIQCIDCCLLIALKNIDVVVSGEFTPNMDCSGECVESTDTLSVFVEAIFRKIESNIFESMESLEHVERNLREIFGLCQDYEVFFASFCSVVLQNLNQFTMLCKNSMLHLLNNLLHEFGKEAVVTSLESLIRGHRSAKRGIANFLINTGDISGFIAMVEVLYHFHNHGMNLSLILPQHMLKPFEIFDVDKDPSEDHIISAVVRHKKFCSIAKQLISTAFKHQNISFVNLVKKEDRRDELQAEFNHTELILFYDKLEHCFQHFCYFLNDSDNSLIALTEKISHDSKTEFLKEKSIIQAGDWIFYMQDNESTSFLQQTQPYVIDHNVVYSKDIQDDNILDDQDDENVQSNVSYHLKDIEDKNILDDQDYESVQCDVSSHLKDIQDDNISDNQVVENVQSDVLYHLKDLKGDDRMDIQNKISSNLDVQELATIDSQFVLLQSDLDKYWDARQNSNPQMKERRFNTTRIGFEWPKLYGSPCVVIIKYNHALKFNSKKKVAFANINGICKICNSTHKYRIAQNPFAESLDEDDRVRYRAINDMLVDVTVTGKFYEVNGKPDISQPVHEREKAAGYHLKGEERQLLADYATNKGVASAYSDQFAFMKKDEMAKFNITSIRSREVIKQAMQESEKKLRGGDTPYDAIKTVYLQQKMDFSPHYEQTAASMALPGNVRKFEEEPLKVYFANYDQLKIGGSYLNSNTETVINLDSSGKFWQDGHKVGKNALNSAIVIPPVAKGYSPFPIFETISYSNKTIDFLQFLQYAWHFMSKALNNDKIAYPSVAVSDFSFANLFAFLEFFDHTTMEEYLQTTFKCFGKNEKFPYDTVITICKNHNIPTFLKTARALKVDKAVADTFVCGFMKVLEVSINSF